jgi:hypothetical protein
MLRSEERPPLLETVTSSARTLRKEHVTSYLPAQIQQAIQKGTANVL